MGRIFIVDDDKDTRELIAETLKKEGISSIPARNADDCFRKLEENKNTPPDLIILDLNLPGVSGWDVCKILKKEKGTRSIPVVLITGHYKSSTDTIFGFQHGADDYIIKPFNPNVLLARIKAILRRSACGASSGQEFLYSCDKKIIIDVNNRTVKLLQKKNAGENSGAEIPDLTPKEFELLCLFLKKPGQILSRSAIMEVVWQQDYFDTSRTVDKHIETLRKKLGNLGVRIITVTGAGYKFSGED